ncbi:MAG TPA: hypothetical protein VEC06_05700 [Paucimonas sp.]|nr:hypothetical protein [Paucimonas sp.]
MSKQEIVAMLRAALRDVMAERMVAKTDKETRAARIALKRFQSQRMGGTHADLLASSDTAAAARFFLEDLYGTHDMTQRDADIERIVPTMERMLPATALQTIAEAILLDALSESLDAAMARHLGIEFDENAYVEAYRAVSLPADRERQLAYVRSVGLSLCELVRIPLIGATLRMMRGPAHIAGLGQLHDFLERGFQAFKAMKAPRDFVETTIARETRIMRNLYGGVPSPFEIE